MDFPILIRRPALAHDDRSKAYPELQAKKAGDAFEIFSENLRHPNKDIRLMTLRILCHFETLSSEEIKKSLPKGNVSRYPLFCILTSSRFLTSIMTI